MGLNHEANSMRAVYMAEWGSAQEEVDVKDAVATAWENLCAVALSKVSMAESESRMDHKELLLGIANGCEVAAADLRANPGEWDDRRMQICHKKWLHLIIGINPFGTIHEDWGD